ncbi:MAG TPA: SLC13 family permease [Thermohalobaculum sp.]|nr:SLC13 family permease [Thermohalobaculum sp.]
MPTDQIILFAILAVLFGLLIWGRWRFDLVAFAMLMVAVVSGAVPVDEAFSGFGHPATVIVALVLIVSRGLTNAGVIELVARRVVDASRPLFAHIGIMSAVAAALSAIMNNVAALALLMPVEIQAAKKAERSPALSLMPLSFASILGGLVTLIGTPPNIIVASFRERTFGEPFGMFDFTPVGGVCAVVGVAFVALVGWRLVPAERAAKNAAAELQALEEYVSELEVPEGSEIGSEDMEKLDELAEEHDVRLLGVLRRARRLAPVSGAALAPGDVLVIEGGPEGIEGFAGALGLGHLEQGDEDDRAGRARDFEMRELVVPPGAPAEGQTVSTLHLRRRHGVSLLGISRQGERIRKRLMRVVIRPGDVLLLLGRAENLDAATERLGGLPLAERGLHVVQRQFAGIAVALFAGAIALASFGLLDLAIALGCTVVLFVLIGIVPLRDLYGSIEWSIIVLLGALIPIGEALETSGGTGLIASGLLAASEGYAPWVVLTLLMIVTMTLSDVMNNTAMAVIAAPIAIDVAARLDANPDPFLMAVAVSASCAFLTPIGHKNNVLIMGPGGYRFGDYWRMGLPLEVLIVAVGVPMILWVWPL